MIDDPDIFHAAKLLIDQHGEHRGSQCSRTPPGLATEAQRSGGYFVRPDTANDC